MVMLDLVLDVQSRKTAEFVKSKCRKVRVQMKLCTVGLCRPGVSLRPVK